MSEGLAHGGGLLAGKIDDILMILGFVWHLALLVVLHQQSPLFKTSSVLPTTSSG
jgi:hypothetical protein